MAKIYKAGVFTMRISGLPELKKAYQKQIDLIRDDIKTEIELNTKYMQEDAREMASGTVNPSGSFVRDGEGGQGTGLEMFPLGSRGVIAERSGRLKANITSSVSDTSKHGGYITGEVGLGKDMRPPRGSLKATGQNAIKWPESTDTSSIIVGKKPADGDIYPPEGDDPTEYIPQIILGTEIIIGRNIFRQALLENIKENKLIKSISTRLRKRFN